MLIGMFNAEESWEKSQTWDLENGAQIIVSFDEVYHRDKVTRIELNGEVWHCSDGIKNLPDFAKPWLVNVTPNATTWLVVPQFERVWDGVRRATN